MVESTGHLVTLVKIAILVGWMFIILQLLQIWTPPYSRHRTLERFHCDGCRPHKLDTKSFHDQF